MKKKLLILSFSPLHTDARVLKQIHLFKNQYHVTTCGYGPQVTGVDEHIQIPDGMSVAPHGRYITAKLYRRCYWNSSAVTSARALLGGKTFDAVLANDVEAAPLALSLRPQGGVHADLHEYAPSLHEDNPAWKKRISPYMSWLCRQYVKKADSASTVGRGIAEEYRRKFSIEATVVRNVTPYLSLSPTECVFPIRLIHSGACMRNRAIHTMVEAVKASHNEITFDLFLTPNHPDYLDELKKLAADDDRITINPPVSYQELIPTLGRFDVGLFYLPPNTYNHRYALPNKVFDYLQARLGIVITPNPEMASLVEEERIGVACDEYSVDAFQRAIDQLTPSKVAEWKNNADRVASEWSVEREVVPWSNAIGELMDKVAQ